MDLAKPEQLQFLSRWGLVRESVKVIRFGYSLITEPIANSIIMDQFNLTFARPHPEIEEGINVEDVHRELGKLLKLTVAFLVASVAFFPLSTSAIAYSVACIYSENITSYKKVLNFLQRVWKRLMITFFWAMLMIFMSGFLSTILILILAAMLALIFQGSQVVIIVVVCAAMVGLLVGAIYLSCVWRLASVGKRSVACRIYFMYSILALLISLGFRMSVVQARSSGVMRRSVFGCVFILLIQFFYFACKAHHHESIDSLQLLEHTGSYLGENVPLKDNI
ncbi:hypothetical protein KP509_09G017800 [Ceratopteris richardii]|uniref:Uncharacterized protein n=1 Tax=Ceratopteris richardii TaxID=49495 RepID=A0A8T2TYE1_CERRI|nr:hypothetical protein KP509_09G017800 [Ceratopteris richardii]